MKKYTNSILMLAYITFIFVAVFTKNLLSATKWSHIIVAITVTSWVIVSSDILESMALIMEESINGTKRKVQSILFEIRRNKSVNNRLDVIMVDENGTSMGKTAKQTIDSMEQSSLKSLKTINKEESIKPWLNVFACIFLYVGFVLFFCTLLFEPVYTFFNNKIEGMSALAFGMILAGQYFEGVLKKCIKSIEKELTSIEEGMKLLNDSYEKETTNSTN